MRNLFLSVASSCNAIMSLVFSVQDIESIFGIVFTSLGILILLINFGLRLYDKLKDGKLSDEDINELEEEVKKIEEHFK